MIEYAFALVWVGMRNLILFNKPNLVLSQFQDTTGRPTLAQFLNTKDCKGFYPAGRLDYDSEGLLLLTNNGALQDRICAPKFKLPKTYWVQVEGEPTQTSLAKLRQGVQLKDGKTLPAKAQLITPPNVWARVPAIRQRQSIPTQWIELVITEGKNRQVRRMTAAVGHPTLRLIRIAIGPWRLEQLAPGEFEFSQINVPKNQNNTRRHHP